MDMHTWLLSSSSYNNNDNKWDQADQGLTQARGLLGLCYERGTGVARDDEMAVGLLAYLCLLQQANQIVFSVTKTFRGCWFLLLSFFLLLFFWGKEEGRGENIELEHVAFFFIGRMRGVNCDVKMVG